MLNIAHYQRTANHNCSEISPHTNQKDHHQKSTNDNCQRGCGEKGSLLLCWWEWKSIQLLQKTVWRFLKKLGIKLPYDPTVPLLGIYLERAIIEIGPCTPKFTEALFLIAGTRKQARCQLTDEWIKKLWYINANEYYSTIKWNAYESVLLRWMNVEPLKQSEVSQRRKHHALSYVYTHMGSRKTALRNLFAEQQCRHREQSYCPGEGGKERVGRMEIAAGKQIHCHTSERQLVGMCHVTQGAHTRALWQPRR